MSPAGLQDASRLRPDAQRRDRQQGHQVPAPGRGVHIRALAGPDLQGQEAGQQGGAGPQTSERREQTEVHVQKGKGVFVVGGGGAHAALVEAEPPSLCSSVC